MNAQLADIDLLGGLLRQAVERFHGRDLKEIAPMDRIAGAGAALGCLVCPTASALHRYGVWGVLHEIGHFAIAPRFLWDIPAHIHAAAAGQRPPLPSVRAFALAITPQGEILRGGYSCRDATWAENPHPLTDWHVRAWQWWAARDPGLSPTSTRRTVSSHPGELPPEVLTEPYVTLSRHTAPVSYCQFRFLTGLAYLICITQNEFANYSFTMKINDPRLSKTLMQITWIIGGIGFWNGFNALGAGNVESSTQWIAAWAVGGVGILSFVRHAVFHRSDALRMGWDLGARNDFQLEVGFANLAWGVVAIVGVLQGWGTEALGALVLLVGIYMLQAAVLHLLELKEAKQPRYASKFANSAYAICMLWFGIYAFSS